MNTENIGAFIKELREEMNLNQGELANILFVDRSLVSKWEKGSIIISSAYLNALSKLFKVSVDELLAGKRKTKDNKKEIENVKLDIYDKLSRKVKRQKSKILILCLLLFLVAFLFLLSFFVNFYSSVKVYRLHYTTDSFSTINGYFFENKDRVYFFLDSDYGDRKDEIERITLYYKIDNERKDIYSISDPWLINFVDYNGYNEYVDFEKIDEIINNFYIEFKLKNAEVESSKVDFNLEYVNKKVFGDKSESISKKVLETTEEIKYNKTDLYYKLQLLATIYKDREGFDRIKYDGVDYEAFISSDSLNLIFDIDGENYIYEYISINSEFFYLYKEKNDKSYEIIYTQNVEENICLEGTCETYENDIKILKEIVDLLLKKNEKKSSKK